MLLSGGLKELIFKTMCFLFIIILLTEPGIANNLLRESSVYAITSVAPTLFPYMIMASMISIGRSSAVIGAVFYPLTGYCLKINSAKAGIVIIVALIGGFAAATVALNRFVENGDISNKEAQRIFPAILIPSVPFIIFVVGETFFGSYQVGVLVASAVIISSFLSAIILSFGSKKNDENEKPCENNINIAEHITDSIRNATLNTLYVCGFITFFGTLSGMIAHYLPQEIAFVVAIVFEFSTAVNIVHGQGIYLTTIALTVLGMCSIFQTIVIYKETIQIFGFIVTRILTTLIAFITLKVLFSIFPMDLQVYSGAENIYILPYQYNLELSILVFLIIIISFTDFISKKGLH